MRLLLGLRRSALVGCLVALLATDQLPVRAAEPVEAFLEGLRRRQMFDMAQAYLESLKTSNLVSAKVKQTILYQQGETLVEEAKTLRDASLRMKKLEEARQRFDAFLKAHPNHSLAASASTQLGNILLERGRAQLDLSKRPTQVARKEQLVAEARQFFTGSQQVFDGAVAKYLEELQKFPKAIEPKDKQQIAARNAVRLNLLQARLFAATVRYESSKAYDPGSDEWKSLLHKGAEQFGEIYQSNEKIIAGLFARMWQGRCMQELGDLTQALTFYEQLLVQPDSEEFRDLKRKSLRSALECWIDDKEKKYDEAVKQGENWVKQARGQEDLTPEGLAIHWLTAVAYERLAKTKKDADVEKFEKAAAEHASVVAKTPGEFQKPAKEFVAKYRKIETSTEPTTFADARTRAKSELDAMIVADGNIKSAAATQKEANKIAEWQKERDRARLAAVNYYQLALSLRDRETTIEAVNDCRYYLCYLNYDWGRYFDAAVIGEFLARRYPESSVARPSGKIALAAYLQAYNAAPADDRATESSHMTSIAEYLGTKWPLEAEGEEAWMILGDVALRNQDLAKAAEYLNRIRPESPRRGEAELKAGQAVWGAYQTAARLPAAERPAQADLDQQLAHAKEILERAVKRMRDSQAAGGELTSTLLSAELALAQLYVDTGHADQSIAVLERPETGVLALVAANSPLAARGSFISEAYTTALRGYVGTQRLEDAERMMQALDKQSGESADAANLTRIYVRLGIELEQQVAQLREEKRTGDLERVLKGFELFLDRIAARQQGTTSASLSWVAETYYRLAQGLGSDKSSAAAQAYYRKAADTYTRMLDQSAKDPNYLSAAAQNGVRIRLARCESGLGEYESALEQIEAILATNPNTLEAQVAAAENYERWGQKDPAYYSQAIGGRPATANDKYEIWGWNKLALRLQKLPKHAELYREARYKVADCSYKAAMAKSGKEKADGLSRAATLIESMARIDPTMGGDAWRPRFDELLKNIQRAAGRKPDGLVKPPPSAEQTTAAGAAS